MERGRGGGRRERGGGGADLHTYRHKTDRCTETESEVHWEGKQAGTGYLFNIEINRDSTRALGTHFFLLFRQNSSV